MAEDPDSYIADQPVAQARALRRLRNFLADRIAHAGVAVEEAMSYGMPGFRVLSGPGRGKMLLGYAGWQAHLAIYPHSGSVLAQMHAETRGMSQTNSALHVAIGDLPPEAVVDRMIQLRLQEIGRPPAP
ncbi:hypothetical protein OB2597_00465 [Pseudooceanicola batsensis HTCC2597]|uniref:YdhG-like domain-containing protein n=1 Tax=Pseudooceanicola batsensis (strain ATCC BAA-863 / DSM 15984 / KCTC 12145 / HTCC2597) TaxID=252305 RepID=A3U1R0_PSEBH|nr:DUF1801 domain-containing protein [Pseudooceanicola batsensis]EAQ01844.1 hypothetical protein OB2597_00465 [Pseudooceanicola batsensis HTCC2597]